MKDWYFVPLKAKASLVGRADKKGYLDRVARDLDGSLYVHILAYLGGLGAINL